MQIWEKKGSSFVHMDASDLKTLKNNSIVNFAKNQNFISHDFLNFDMNEFIPEEFVCALIEINHIVLHLNSMVKDKVNFINKSLTMENIEIENMDDYCYLTINDEKENPQIFRSKLLIASDGANSVIRNKLKMQTTGYDYNETGLICTLRGNKKVPIAFQRFLHNGIFALLPLYDDLYSIVSSMPKSINEDLRNLPDDQFLKFVNNILHSHSEMDTSQIDRLSIRNNYIQPPVITEILSKKFELNLQMQYANKVIDKNCILIGDASHVIHPMAGQGMNLGIMDSALLANEICSNINTGKRINDIRSMNDFSFKSQMNTRLMVATLECLRLVYHPTNPILTAVRNMGMSLSNSSEIMRGLFILSASGLASQPPKFEWE